MFARRTEDHSLAYHGDGLGADLPARDELHMCLPTQTCYVIMNGKPAAGLIPPRSAPPSTWYGRLWQSVRQADQKPSR